MKRVTRAVGPEDLRTLLERPPRATLAFVRDGSIEALPVPFRHRDGRYLVGFQTGGVAAPTGRVKLLIDDGFWYFELRGLWMRGALVACETPAEAPPGYDWFELKSEKTAAWDYGSMREG